ncbi:4-hydroxy-3-methylbut-2-enyl diphosphatesynthase [Striga asiatica]|uniref:4-hydroxy-3-methylbut-2-enyl diphosphatesynthase n=1 Tax=Striga asiatica TaxID=4170 RepID=A0A5A7RC07_STRAF|nr:4-hydroxy-3-methylbut-2-enyl diphosphatesynthase [Striga asiatica]
MEVFNKSGLGKRIPDILATHSYRAGEEKSMREMLMAMQRQALLEQAEAERNAYSQNSIEKDHHIQEPIITVKKVETGATHLLPKTFRLVVVVGEEPKSNLELLKEDCKSAVFDAERGRARLSNNQHKWSMYVMTTKRDTFSCVECSPDSLISSINSSGDDMVIFPPPFPNFITMFMAFILPSSANLVRFLASSNSNSLTFIAPSISFMTSSNREQVPALISTLRPLAYSTMGPHIF